MLEGGAQGTTEALVESWPWTVVVVVVVVVVASSTGTEVFTERSLECSRKFEG